MGNTQATPNGRHGHNHSTTAATSMTTIQPQTFISTPVFPTLTQPTTTDSTTTAVAPQTLQSTDSSSTTQTSLLPSASPYSPSTTVTSFPAQAAQTSAANPVESSSSRLPPFLSHRRAAVIGLTACSILFFAVLFAAILYFFFRRRRKRAENEKRDVVEKIEPRGGASEKPIEWNHAHTNQLIALAEKRRDEILAERGRLTVAKFTHPKSQKTSPPTLISSMSKKEDDEAITVYWDVTTQGTLTKPGTPFPDSPTYATNIRNDTPTNPADGTDDDSVTVNNEPDTGDLRIPARNPARLMKPRRSNETFF